MFILKLSIQNVKFTMTTNTQQIPLLNINELRFIKVSKSDVMIHERTTPQRITNIFDCPNKRNTTIIVFTSVIFDIYNFTGRRVTRQKIQEEEQARWNRLPLCRYMQPELKCQCMCLNETTLKSTIINHITGCKLRFNHGYFDSVHILGLKPDMGYCIIKTKRSSVVFYA